MACATSFVNYSDIVLFTSIAYWVVDMQSDLHEFQDCRWPVYTWLLWSYVFVVISRFMNIVGNIAACKDPEEHGDYLINLRHQGLLPRVLATIVWFVIMPCFLLWTLLGSYWIADSKLHSSECLPPSVTLLFVVAWHALCYVWLILHGFAATIATRLEFQLQSAEADLREIESDEMRSRWDWVAQPRTYSSLSGQTSTHLTPSEIIALPCSVCRDSDADSECAICLEGFKADEQIRQIPGCGHTFHRSCIDLWLLRCAHCPLCKGDVRASST